MWTRSCCVSTQVVACLIASSEIIFVIGLGASTKFRIFIANEGNPAHNKEDDHEFTI